tara:strand:- start:530 stop:1231 length:702 start_codon:yes stop_codon:yes gene_type:complete
LSKFATGKWAYGISDRSGFRYRLRDMRKEWNGLLVGKDEWEAKQPQLEPIRATPDPQALRNPRPEQNVAQKNNIQWGWNPVGMVGDGGLTPNNLIAQGSVGTVTIGTTETEILTGVSATGFVGDVAISAAATYTVTVQSYGGGNRYYIDGTRQPTLNLSEGSTYQFDWSAATGHPLRFSTTSDGTHGGGSEYTTGVTINTGTYTSTITVAVGAPTLYYYCQFHSQMGGQINTP